MFTIIIILSLALAAIILFAIRRKKNGAEQDALHSAFDAQIRQQVLANKIFPVKDISGLQYLYHVENNPENYERMKVMISEHEVGKLTEDDFTREHTMDDILLVMVTTPEQKAYLVMLFDGIDHPQGPVLAHMYEAPQM